MIPHRICPQLLILLIVQLIISKHTTSPTTTDTPPSSPPSTTSRGVNDKINQIYLDVSEADTNMHLEAIRDLPLSTYKLSYERGGQGRTRVGPVGPEVAAIIPEAVEIVPKRTLPPLEKGGEKVVIENVPVVHEQTLFMYGVGATKEMIKILDKLEKEMEEEVERSAQIEMEISRLEELTANSMDGGAEVRMRSSAAEAKQIRSELDLELERAKEEIEYAELMKEQEVAQLKKNEDLVLARLKKEDEAARKRAEATMAKKLETAMKMEEERAKGEESISAAQHERELEIQRTKEMMKAETARAEALAKAEAERMNEDVTLRLMKAEAEQARIRNVAAVKEGFEWLGKGFSEFLNNPRDVLIMVGYFAACMAGVYLAKEMAIFVRVVMESMLGKPKLVRETTKKSWFISLFIRFWEAITRLAGIGVMSGEAVLKYCEEVFDDVILEGELKSRVVGLAMSAKKAREYDAPHRHVLFYGPPGTGKTMVAKKLAECVGMDYALMSGGDVGPLGSDGVTQIHSLFRWAKTSNKGVLLFIDEAEAFLGSRSEAKMSESAHNALNALLYNTGGERKDFMLVLATNRAEDLDAAVLDRCDESLFFGLPEKPGREKLLELYFRKYVIEAVSELAANAGILSKLGLAKNLAEGIEVEEEATKMGWAKDSADKTKGFSGRELAKVMIAVQGVLYGSENGKIGVQEINKVVRQKVTEHAEKKRMVSGAGPPKGAPPSDRRSPSTQRR
eukprot:CAMPEP_0182490716 /NCGR_PEP_ID=MMETSP1321-20130603/470_1 /TAXON_ID=91990 /ORGANISM="Bolidomonas sp., Strain RCC1657" /LENGTH=734 /DNA_ID=CAMNT_0024692941 /DNA_START=28 /DNA_END=2229 /DNA_ORIENTATION=+